MEQSQLKWVATSPPPKIRIHQHPLLPRSASAFACEISYWSAIKQSIREGVKLLALLRYRMDWINILLYSQVVRSTTDLALKWSFSQNHFFGCQKETNCHSSQ